MISPLTHEYPRWEMDPDTREDRFVWPGRPRFVGAKRARELRKRGVPLLACHAVLDQSQGMFAPGNVEPITPGRPGKKSARYCWFETEESRAYRKLARKLSNWLALNPWKRTGVIFSQPNIDRLTAALDTALGPDRCTQYVLRILPQSPEDRAARKSPAIQMLYWGDPI